MNTHRVYDTFNRRVISEHRSIISAVKAQAKFSRDIVRANGSNSYIPTRIEYDADGDWIGCDPADVHDAEWAAGIH
jgi:hypothetical protein